MNHIASQSDHGRVEQALTTSLRKLGVDYVDLYLMHWPMAYDATGADNMTCFKCLTDPPLTTVVWLPTHRQHATAGREPDVRRDVARNGEAPRGW